MTRRFLILLVLAGTLAGCTLRPGPNSPPLQVHPDMDDQPKYRPQARSSFFSDGRATRKPVDGTVARGQLREDEAFFTGKAGNEFVKTLPVPITEALLKRGQERFNISCSPCHGRTGAGNGMVAQRAGSALPAANLHDERLRQVPDGYLFDVITNGVRLMYPLRHQIPEDDRWAIVSYVRALQRSQRAAPGDVPAGQQVN
jgi:mono/diheme cytochrome c family protein